MDVTDFSTTSDCRSWREEYPSTSRLKGVGNTNLPRSTDQKRLLNILIYCVQWRSGLVNVWSYPESQRRERIQIELSYIHDSSSDTVGPRTSQILLVLFFTTFLVEVFGGVSVWSGSSSKLIFCILIHESLLSTPEGFRSETLTFWPTTWVTNNYLSLRKFLRTEERLMT